MFQCKEPQQKKQSPELMLLTAVKLNCPLRLVTARVSLSLTFTGTCTALKGRSKADTRGHESTCRAMCPSLLSR